MEQRNAARYRLRALIGFLLLDLAEYRSEEEAKAGFERYRAICSQERRSNPYTLFLVDWEKGITIAEHTELPEGFEEIPLTENKA